MPREHYPAPYAIVDLWLKYGAVGAESYEAEARSIADLMCTPVSRNLVRVFLLQTRLKSLGGKPDGEFRHVHVIGAGVMGGDIAAWAALRGMTVTLAGPERGIDRSRPWLAQRRCSRSASRTRRRRRRRRAPAAPMSPETAPARPMS